MACTAYKIPLGKLQTIEWFLSQSKGDNMFVDRAAGAVVSRSACFETRVSDKNKIVEWRVLVDSVGIWE